MNNAILLAMVGLGTVIVVAESRRSRRAKRRDVERRVEVARWENEGGAVPPPEVDVPVTEQVCPA